MPMQKPLFFFFVPNLHVLISLKMDEFFAYDVVKNKQHRHKFKVKTKIKLQFGFSTARADQPKLRAKVFSSFSIWIAIFHPRFSNESAPSEKS